MKKVKKILTIGITIALISQIYINLFSSNFRISLSVILFPIILMFCKDLNVIKTSIATSLLVFLFRFFISFSASFNYNESIFINYPVVFFYTIYGIVFHILDVQNEKKLYRIILGLWISDFISNLCELLLRFDHTINSTIYNVIKILAFVALIRSIFVIISIIILKNYRILLLKEEHEEKYRKLIFLISSLKSEIYFMNRHMDNIEEVMSKSFKLYEQLLLVDDYSNLKDLSLSITKDIHEIKKDYINVIRGIKELTDNKFENEKMTLDDVFHILEDSTIKYINSINADIDVIFERAENINVKEHYALISILRNLINNSIESMNNKGDKGIVIVRYFNTINNHVFMVSDNGKGIKEKDKDYVFKPGFSTKFNLETGDINRGVGLTVVKEMVENRFQGRIIIESKYNEGTVFEIILPKDKFKEGFDEVLYS